jgi:cytochrome c556
MRFLVIPAMLGAVFIAMGAGFAPAAAQEAMKIVQDRQATMKQQGKAMEAIKAFVEGKGELAPAQAAAVDLSQHIAKIPGMFPTGSGMEQFPGKSGAKPAIWTEHDKFVAAQKTAQTKADALVEATKGGDKAAIAAAFADMGKAGCGGCHTPFREKI